MGHNIDNLKSHILPLSQSKKFAKAKKEWKLVDVEIHEDFDHCPCGQPIKELCYIENQLNGNRTYVGNVCVNRFIGISTGALFAGLKRIAKDDAANPNEDLIIHAHQLGYLYSDKEFNFLMQIKNKRILSDAQTSWKRKINRRIINKTIVSSS